MPSSFWILTHVVMTRVVLFGFSIVPSNLEWIATKPKSLPSEGEVGEPEGRR